VNDAASPTDPLDTGDDRLGPVPPLPDLPELGRSTLRRATWLGVLRSACIAVVLLVALDALWSHLAAPAIAERHERDALIERQLRGALQSLYPSAEISPPRRSVGRDASLTYRFFVGEPDDEGRRRQVPFDFEVSAAGTIDVDDRSFWTGISDTETLAYRDTAPEAVTSFLAAVDRLPSGAVVSFALPLPTPVTDDAAEALWRDLEAAGITPSGYLLAPDRPGNPRGWRGPDLSAFRRWDEAMNRDDGVEAGSAVIGVVGRDAGRAPDAAVTGVVFHAVAAERIPDAIDAVRPTEAIVRSVGLRLPDATGD